MALASTDGEIIAEFAQTRIGNPLLDEAHRLFDDLRYVGRGCAGNPRPWGGVFGPPLTGKTMSVTTYIEAKVVDELIQNGKFATDMDKKEIARQQRTVVSVIVSPQATQRSFAVDILEALGDPLPSRGGTAQELLARACECLRLNGTELLIIEEVQHLFDQMTSRARTPCAGAAVTETLKTLLLKGVAPVVLVGGMEARYHLMNNVELAARCVKELEFGALENADEVQCDALAFHRV